MPDGDWLVRSLGVQKAYDRKVTSALRQAASDVEEQMSKWTRTNIGDKAKRYQLSLARAQIRQIIKSMFQGLGTTIAQGQRDAAEAAAQATLAEDAKVLNVLFPESDMRERWERSFIATARHGIQAMVNRVAGVSPTYSLSQRVYRSGALAAGQLDRQINANLARGANSRDLSLAVRRSILPNTPGGVSFAAQRLARTEINNAFHAQSIMSFEDEPWVETVKWNLSNMHIPDPGDPCEEYARIGTFNKYAVPLRPHPQCMCYVTPVMTSFQSFADNLRAGVYDSYYESMRRAA